MQNEKSIENEVQEEKTFSENEIKKRLKARSKSELINIIINLSSKIDELKESVKDGKE
jgi:hypothetical protein